MEELTLTDTPTPIYGVESGDQEMASGSRWPYIRPKNGDRVRFHFLTNGSDPWLVATKFHPIGEGKGRRDIVCVSALTRGEEQCAICELDSGQNRRNMFACWLWVDYILHPHDNPDEEGNSWEQKKLKIRVSDGTEKERIVFMEKIDEEDAAKVLWLPAGRQKVWWSQFTNAWMQSQNLRKHFYELYRVGEGRDDTNYTLTALKEDPLNEDVLEKDNVKDLPNIVDIFRSSLASMPSGDAVMGSDSLDGQSAEALPSAEATSVDPSSDLL